MTSLRPDWLLCWCHSKFLSVFMFEDRAFLFYTWGCENLAWTILGKCQRCPHAAPYPPKWILRSFSLLISTFLLFFLSSASKISWARYFLSSWLPTNFTFKGSIRLFTEDNMNWHHILAPQPVPNVLLSGRSMMNCSPPFFASLGQSWCCNLHTIIC